MSRHSVVIAVVLIAVLASLIYYMKEREFRLPAHGTSALRAPEKAGRDEVAARLAVAPSVSRHVHKGFSEKEYEFLWRKYKPNSGLGDGPLSRDRLDNLAKIAKNSTRDKKTLPAFEDVIYGKSEALENKLDTGLSADTTIYLDYPYNAPVSLLDMAIRAGQRDIISELLRHGASVGLLTEVAPDGTPLKVEAPLPAAAAAGEDDVVRLLLQNGANIEQGRGLQNNDQTALNAAVMMQNVSTAYLLLTHGADVNSALGPGGTVPQILMPPHNAPPRMIALRDLLRQYGARMPSGQ